MLRILLLLFSLTRIQPYGTEDDDRFKCTLPPFPKNGAYSVLQPQPENWKLRYRPGHQLTSYTIAWRCYRSHNLLGPTTQTCFDDGSVDNPADNVQCVHNASIQPYDDTKTFNCTLPPFPDDGNYAVEEAQPGNWNPTSEDSDFYSYGPGEKVKTYRIYWYCYNGHLTAPKTQNCSEDGSVDFDTEKIKCANSTDVFNTKPDEDEVNTYNCTLPPFPKYGRYWVISPTLYENISYDMAIPRVLGPGEKVKSYTLEWSCYLYNGLLGPKNQTCFEDGSIDQPSESVECVPYCEMESNNGQNVVTSCGKEARCIVPPQHGTEDSQLTIISGSPALDDNEDCRFIAIGALANGWSVKPGTLPWHAGIYTKRKSPYMQVCGGSLVSSTVVISAAHCFWNEAEKKQQPASNYAVAVGKIYRPWNDKHDNYAQKSDVAEVKIPPHFKGSTTNLQDDIALVIVTYAFKLGNEFHVRPVCLDFNVELDKQQLTPGYSGKVAGWGLTSEDGPASPVLNQAYLPVIDIDQCYAKSDLTFQTRITNDKFCAGYQNGTAVCKGDSGGGLVFVDVSDAPKSFRHILRGVVSGAPDNDHLCNTYSWASFTHILKHEHFIRETVPAKPPRTDLPKYIGEI